ncbi:MAG TPA: hydroxyacid dehydrogenase [Burkholderiales bacterium]
MTRVLLTDPIDLSGEELLRARGAEVVLAPEGSPATVKRLAAEADGIIIRSKLPEDIFEAAPRVRAVTIHGTGTDLVPLAAANARGVLVANLPGENAQSVAEYCVMAMLMLARNVMAISSAMRGQPWDEARKLAFQARELAGLTVGIVGVGEIGKRVAQICRNGFGMRVLGNQRRMDRLPPEAEGTSLDELVAQSDFVVLACPLTPETQHLFNAARLGAMKCEAWLINVGRGPVVDETALIDALHERRIAGAMLDVYEHYRIAPGHPLFALNNVILTPHLAGSTRESRARAAVRAADEMLRMLAGDKPRNLVNPEAWNERRPQDR